MQRLVWQWACQLKSVLVNNPVYHKAKETRSFPAEHGNENVRCRVAMQCWGTSCVDGWRPTSNNRQVFASVAVRRREYCICGPCGGSANSFLGFWSGKILATLSQMLHLFQKLTVRGMLGSVLRSQRVYRVYRRVSCPLLMSVMSCRASIFV